MIGRRAQEGTSNLSISPISGRQLLLSAALLASKADCTRSILALVSSDVRRNF